LGWLFAVNFLKQIFCDHAKVDGHNISVSSSSAVPMLGIVALKTITDKNTIIILPFDGYLVKSVLRCQKYS
jgi:hypothetical protein